MNKESFFIYPIYLDSSRTYSKGRKYAKNKCIPQPTSQEISKALTQLDIEHKFDASKRHPREPFVYGRFMINKSFEREYVVKGLVSVIKENRIKKPEPTKSAESKVGDKKKNDANNPLGLQPRKKKKAKK